MIGTASGRNVLFLEELGANEVINYEEEDFSEKLTDIDVVFDTLGGKVQEQSLKVLKPGGILVSTVGIRDEAAVKARGLRSAAYMAKSLPDRAADRNLIDAGVVIPHFLADLPLKGGGGRRVAAHTRGKIVLQVRE